MDDPIADIPAVVHALTQGTPSQQLETLTTHFTSTASFTHPFCRTGSFEGSRHLILAIFRWYKIMSPLVDLEIKGIAFDDTNLVLYVDIEQVFAIWFVPFHRSKVRLTTKLGLTRRAAGSRTGLETKKYYIQRQEDLYPVDQFVQFFAPWGIGTAIVFGWHFVATFFCVLLSVALSWFTSLEDKYAKRNATGVGKLVMDGVYAIQERRIYSWNTQKQTANGKKVAKQIQDTASDINKSLAEDMDERNGEAGSVQRFGGMQVVT